MVKVVADAFTWAIFIAIGVFGTVVPIFIGVHYFPAIATRVSSRAVGVVFAVLLAIACGATGLWIVVGPYALWTARKRAAPPSVAST